MNYYSQQDKKAKLRNTFENNMSAYIKFSKAQISKIIQSGRFVGSLLSKIEVPLMKVVATSAKFFLAWLGITAAAPTIICSDVTSQVGAFSYECFFKPLWRTMKNSGRQRSGWEDRLLKIIKSEKKDFENTIFCAVFTCSNCADREKNKSN